MGRPKNPKPLDLQLEKNMKTGLYDACEDGIIYSMSLESLNDLKKHFKYNHSIAQWYHQLQKEDKKIIERSGNIPPDDNGFIPDFMPEY